MFFLIHATLYQKAFDLYVNKKFEHAKKLLHKIADQEKDSKERQYASSLLGKIYYAEKNNEKMLYYFSKADKHSGALNHLGVYYQRLGYYHQASKYLKQAIAYNNLLALVNFANCQIALGNYEIGAKYLKHALDKKELSGAFCLGEFYMHISLYLKKKNLPKTPQVLQPNPIEGFKWLHIAWIYTNQKDKDYPGSSLRHCVLKEYPIFKQSLTYKQQKQGIIRAQEWIKEHPNYFLTNDQIFNTVYKLS